MGLDKSVRRFGVLTNIREIAFSARVVGEQGRDRLMVASDSDATSNLWIFKFSTSLVFSQLDSTRELNRKRGTQVLYRTPRFQD